MSFALWQPEYAEAGIAAFPVAITGGRKKPMVAGYLKLGTDVSRQLALKFPEAEGIGFCLGSRSRVTVVDVDTPDENVLAGALDRHGDSPVIVQTGGGGFHVWYRHAGEGRWIRPVPDVPIDILGSGLLIAPMSRGSRNRYEFLCGGLGDLDSLPVLRGLPSNIVVPTATRPTIKQGARNETLYRNCMRRARRCAGFDELLLFARELNERNIMPHLPEQEVFKTAQSAWGYQQRGENFLAGSSSAILAHDVIDRLAAQNPHAFALLAVLERHHADKDEFLIANALAEKLEWHIDRLRSARAVLVEMNIVRCIHPGGRGPKDPALFAWA